MTPEQLSELHAKVSDTPWSVQSFEEQLSHENAIFAAHAQAFALGRVTLDEAELLQIATNPNHQRRGLAKQMLCDFEHLANVRGCSRLLLEVAADNAPALALYSATGWTRDGLRRGYYRYNNGQRVDAILMSKTI